MPLGPLVYYAEGLERDAHVDILCHQITRDYISHTATFSFVDTTVRVPATRVHHNQMDMESHPGSVTNYPIRLDHVRGVPSTTFQEFHVTSETQFPNYLFALNPHRVSAHATGKCRRSRWLNQ